MTYGEIKRQQATHICKELFEAFFVRHNKSRNKMENKQYCEAKKLFKCSLKYLIMANTIAVKYNITEYVNKAKNIANDINVNLGEE